MVLTLVGMWVEKQSIASSVFLTNLSTYNRHMDWRYTQDNHVNKYSYNYKMHSYYVDKWQTHKLPGSGWKLDLEKSEQISQHSAWILWDSFPPSLASDPWLSSWSEESSGSLCFLEARSLEPAVQKAGGICTHWQEGEGMPVRSGGAEMRGDACLEWGELCKVVGTEAAPGHLERLGFSTVKITIIVHMFLPWVFSCSFGQRVRSDLDIIY